MSGLLSKRYSESLAEMHSFFSSNKSKKVRRNPPKECKKWVVEQEGQCPQCGIYLFTAGTNLEHIHMISLGGGNEPHNLVFMCISCNLLRAQVLRSFAGSGPQELKKAFHSREGDFESYLLWLNLTVDEGIQAAAVREETAGMHQLWLDVGGRASPANPMETRFGRLSEWKEGESSPVFITTETSEKEVGKKYSFGSMFRGWFFGQKEETEPARDLEIPPAVRSEDDWSEILKKEKPTSNNKVKQTPVVIDDAADPIEDLIYSLEGKTLDVALFGQKISQAFDKGSKQARIWLKEKGYSKSTPFGKIILKRYTHLIESHEYTNASLIIEFKEKMPVKADATTIEIDDEYPLISRLNSKNRGFCLPRNPRGLALTLIAFESLREQDILFGDVVAKMSDNMPEQVPRIVNVIVRIRELLNFDVDQLIDWQKVPQPHKLCQDLVNIVVEDWIPNGPNA
ncbi:MAG: HNH endonuclease signature motif containing protein, partial [Candidatus Poseidoniia archaeon]